MIRIIFTLTPALAALALAAPVHADPDAPTPIDLEPNVISDAGHPWVAGILGHQDFSVLNHPDETFEAVVRNDYDLFGGNNDNILVEQDISGNVPLGEQYNYFTFGDFGEVYNNINGTPEAFYTTPFGDLNFPTWFVEAVGPNFFEPSIYFEPLPAAELSGLAGDLSALLTGLW